MTTNINDTQGGWLLGQGEPATQIIGVVGAGTMGAGIAQVAAAAGHPVRLLDARPGAASDARTKIGGALAALVAKGRMEEGERSALQARISSAESMSDFSDAVMVVEVIAENLQAKQGLLRELENHVSPRAVIASNTSSISITALANGMVHPERLAGMHFFNPVPLMKLVEVVSGAETAQGVANAVFETARAWGKTPVHAKSTPGFIVNRIARPFYAEALALLQEQAGTPAELDRLARGAGFRMGPCELMDLIGHDINYAVTQSVFDANFGDRRYVPSLVQKALVDGGRLGRKVGKGFYEGAPSTDAPVAAGEPSLPVQVLGDGPLAARLASRLDAARAGFGYDAQCGFAGLRVGAITLHVTDGRSAAQLAAEGADGQTGVIDLPLSDRGALGVAFAPTVPHAQRLQVTETLRACGFDPVELRDVPGLLVARTVAMLVNEGADAVWQGVCDEDDADLAMELGVNYPAGPFEWLRQIGTGYTVTVLNNLFAATRSERYRTSPLLQQRYWHSRIPA